MLAGSRPNSKHITWQTISAAIVDTVIRPILCQCLHWAPATHEVLTCSVEVGVEYVSRGHYEQSLVGIVVDGGLRWMHTCHVAGLFAIPSLLYPGDQYLYIYIAGVQAPAVCVTYPPVSVSTKSYYNTGRREMYTIGWCHQLRKWNRA
jgi:hypothetical protein